MSKISFRKSMTANVLIIAVAVSMLIGATYAVFNDTSSTNVNTIQAGTLDVELVDANGDSLEGETISFVGGNDLKWEPDGEYALQPVYIANKGDIAFQYKIEVTGIDGSSDLNQYITWSVKVDGVEQQDLSSYEAILQPNSDNVSIELIGTLSHEAPVGVMGKTANAVSINVLARQTNENADYPTV